jgi:hypothetical protein
MSDGGYGVAAHIHAVDSPRVYTPRDDGVAGAVIGILAYPARTEDLAIADLEQMAYR